MFQNQTDSDVTLPPAGLFHQLPGPAAGSGRGGSAGFAPEPSGLGAAVPALSPPAGLPAAQQSADSASAVALQGRIQVRVCFWSFCLVMWPFWKVQNCLVFFFSRYIVKPLCEEKLLPPYPISPPTQQLIEQILTLLLDRWWWWWWWWRNSEFDALAEMLNGTRGLNEATRKKTFLWP